MPNSHRRHAVFAITVTLLFLGCSSSEEPSGSGGNGTGGVGTGGSGAGHVSQGSGGGNVGQGSGGSGGVDNHPPINEDSFNSWCDPSTWGGSVPTSTTDVIIEAGQTVLIDCEATAHTLEIRAGGTLAASRLKSSKLTMHGNLVVRGTLDYGHPADRVHSDANAEIVFQGMNDDDFVGTPSTVDGDGNVIADPPEMKILDSDVGLWVVDSGLVMAAGQLKTAWSKMTDGAGPGDATLEVEDATGWLPGDKVVLTPTERTSVPGYSKHFDELTIASVSGQSVTLSAPPAYPHDGCTGCMRRGEIANLSRNVTIRSFDDTAHAHILATDKGTVQLDGVELRWLGPEKPGGPARRSALYFFRQRSGSEGSFVRHTSIWGGQNGFAEMEASDGIEFTDVAGYDTTGDGVRSGFSMFDEYGCDDGTCGAPKGVFFTEVLAARIIPSMREEDGARIQYLVHGISCGGGPGTGCRRCVATGMEGEQSAGFFWNNDIHLPVGADQAFEDNVSHNQGYNGIRLWQNEETEVPPWSNIQIWSTQEGLFEGAYGNPYEFGNIVVEDSITRDAVLQAVPLSDQQSHVIVRLDGATLGSILISGYVITQFNDQTFKNIHFNGSSPVAVTQDHTGCTDGNEDDPDDTTCIRNWATFENCSFPAGTLPFDFGWQANKHAQWKVRGFASEDPAYSSLPTNFDLYRKDNQVSGGSYYAPFDAWLVPQ